MTAVDYRIYHAINQFVLHHAWLGRGLAVLETWAVPAIAVATFALWLFARPGADRKWKLAAASALAGAARCCLLSQSPADRATERQSKAGSPHQLRGLRPPQERLKQRLWHPGSRLESQRRVALPAVRDARTDVGRFGTCRQGEAPLASPRDQLGQPVRRCCRVERERARGWVGDVFPPPDEDTAVRMQLEIPDA